MGSYAHTSLRRCGQALRAAWWWLRQVSGDAAYENYLRSARRGKVNGARAGLLSRKEFYLAAVEHRSRGVNRCC